MTRARLPQPLRFAVVGALVAALYVLIYTGLLSAGVARQAANLAAFATAVAVQYAAQTLWTFGRPLAVPDQVVRFLCTIALGYAVSALVTGVLGPAFGWPDWLAAAAVTVVLPVQNYLLFRLWVYAASGT